MSGPSDAGPVGRSNVANFGGPGANNAEMNRSDSMPAKPGMAVTMGKSGGS